MIEMILSALACTNMVLCAAQLPTWTTAAIYWAILAGLWGYRSYKKRDNPSHDR